jgi:fatty acid desaturase
MKITFAEFRKKKFFFFQYFLVQMLVIAPIAMILFSKGYFSTELHLHTWHLAILPFAFVFGIQVPVVLHNAVHSNIKNKTLNEIAGEVTGFFVLFGMAPFRISHILHHAHADDVELDPHPPRGKSFAHFLATTQLNTIRVISNLYFNIHGRNAKTYSIMATQMGFYYVGLVSRAAIWFMILGPTMFVAFYIPAFMTNLVVFAHINFATHKTLPTGEIVVVNLNHNLYYKTLNVLSSGAYFHKNHHDRPKLYNPMKMAMASKPAVVRVEQELKVAL